MTGAFSGVPRQVPEQAGFCPTLPFPFLAGTIFAAAKRKGFFERGTYAAGWKSLVPCGRNAYVQGL